MKRFCEMNFIEQFYKRIYETFFKTRKRGVSKRLRVIQF